MTPNLMRNLVRLTVKPLLHPWVPFKLRRVLLNGTRIMQRPIAGVQGARVHLDGIETYQVAPTYRQHESSQQKPPHHERTPQAQDGQSSARQNEPKPQNPTHILYLHGGGYVFGGRATHRQLVDSLALAGNVTVWMPEYRLAPEHAFPAALNDVLHCYLTLLEQGIAADDIVIAGDSAGGGLAMALALELKDRHLAPAKALMLLSPWVDLSLQHASIHDNAPIDPMLSPASLKQCARAYSGATELDNPLCSPLFADLAGLPPMIVQVGSDEILIDDAKALHQRVIEADGDATLQVFDGMWHDFQLHAYQLEPATRAVKQLFLWLNER